MDKFHIGDVFRYARPYSETPEEIDGYPNHFAATYSTGKNLCLLDSGINSIAVIKSIDGNRRPAILIRSTPNKIGSHDTPWQDTFDVDNGHIRYYGDNKEPGKNPAIAPGNKVLLAEFEKHSALDIRIRKDAVPLIFYKAVSIKGKSKGYVEFNGIGIIRDVQLVTQYDRAKNRTFSNYAFDFVVFSLAKENEQFDWSWISARRDSSLSIDDTSKLAPASWNLWIKSGPQSLEKCKRRVSKLLTVSTTEQKPRSNSQEEKTLKAIYDFYNGRKARFEGFAAKITSHVIKQSGANFEMGWITPSTSDGGADFYGAINIGIGFGKTKMILLGQAKCESPNTPTGGNHIARTVARLKRGWIGVYVTTSYFSEAVQREIIEDAYPILLVNGLKLAEVSLNIIHDEGYKSLNDLLNHIDENYDELVQARRPEELLLE